MLLPRRDPVPDAQAAARLAALRPGAAWRAAGSAPVDPAQPVGGWVAPAPAVVTTSSVAPPVPVAPAQPVGGWVTPAPDDDGPVRSWSYAEGRGELEQDLEPEPTLLQRLRAGRVDPGRRGVAALALVAVLAAALTAAVVVRGRPQAVTPSTVVAAGASVPGAAASGAPPGPAGAGAGASGAPVARVVVAVSGDVRRPGLVRLPAGSRVDDAVRAAGGAVRAGDLALVNLARVLVDGEQVVVGPAAPAPVAGQPAAGGVLDLNAATAEDLDDLPGIGPVLADKIVAYRTEQGRFASVDQLREVSGIGESRFADLEKLVRV